MPVPEDIRVYGSTTLLVAVGQQQPAAAAPPWNAANRHRDVTRTITFHYNHGWKSGNWRASGPDWYGASFNLDLDGTLYQCEAMIVRTNHVGGGPDFNNAFSFVNATSIGIELARFGKMHLANGQYKVDDYGGIDFNLVADPPAECDYSQINALAGGSHRFSLRKMRGEHCLNSAARPYYYTKIATFNDDRNDNRGNYPLDVVFTEEQYQTLVLWAKSMCEMHRIPKSFLIDPTTGNEQPWLDVTDLIRLGQPQSVIDENKQRIKAFQGMIGHNNIQRNRMDPGASLDYYRIKRGVADNWWYPVNLDDNARVMDYLDTAHVADYMALSEYRDAAQRNAYFAACEGDVGGYFPIGANRLWHGGVHFPSGANSRQIYAMANGRVVAARIDNGSVNTSQVCLAFRYSRCFVLIKHQVHVRQSANANDEIDYGDNSTETIYSLYMHTAPLNVQLNDDGTFTENYTSYPAWFNHHMIDYATANNGASDPAPRSGEIFYPNQPVCLGDWLGTTGNYVIGFDGASPNYGPTLHLEVFTTADVSTFGNSPWSDAAHRVDDTTEDLVCDLSVLNAWLADTGNPGIDALDIRNALTNMRQIAVKHRSEWSIENREQLSNQIVVGQPAQPVDTADVVSQYQFETNIQPLCFHTQMVAAGADANIVGPYLNNPHVWHIHPLEFMRWMNERVDRHESILRAQDKTRPQTHSTLVMTGEYATGFVNPVPSAAPGAGYPESIWNENRYEIRVNWLCDQTDLAAAPQQTTRFHRRLLDALDMINDRPHGFSLLLGYVSTAAHANSAFAAQHAAGNACDGRPGAGTSAADWYSFYRSARATVDYMINRDGANALNLTMLQDPDAAAGRAQIASSTNATEWARRLDAATGPNDATLTAVDPAFPNLQGELATMRLHLHVA